MIKWTKRALGGLVLVLFVASGGGYLLLRTSLPRISGAIAVNGPSAPVEIIRDRNAIPHIHARSAADAYYALGFAHAQDRLFQMDFMRRVGAGRVSEVVGPKTLGLDRMMRVLGLYRLAEQSVEHLSPDTLAVLDAYAEGVNGFLTRRAGALPPEFIALGYRPEPWRPADSLVWARMMAMRLTGNWRNEALRASLAGRFPPERIEELWPGIEDGAAPTVFGLAGHPIFAGLIDAWPESMRPILASNSWAVAGSGSATGKPILANDPHLGFRAPGLWYPVRIEAPGLALTGATVPGVPFVILGHNGRIAWAFTTTGSDTQDLFVERLDPANPDRYVGPGGTQNFETSDETITVSGGADVTITVRRTRHGPVISDIVPGLDSVAGAGHVIALAATALRRDDLTAEAIHRLNLAGDWPAFRAALRRFHSPQQNITYADTAGNIGFIAPGLVPIRKSGTGNTPAPGWTGTHDWRGFIPFDALPSSFNPSSGRIVNANHRVVPDSYPYHLGLIPTAPYRARRIHELLNATRAHTVPASAAMQADTVSLMARELAPLMTRIAPRSPGASAALRMIRRWDGTMDRDRPEPLIFIAWLRAFNRLLYADELGPAFHAYWRLRPIFVRKALTGHGTWCDDVGTPATETCADTLERALDETLDELASAYGNDPESWRWGDAHFARFRHPIFGRIPILRDLADIRIPSSGGAYTVNRAQHRTANPRSPFASVHGPGFRAIYDLADLDASLFMQSTGQSGNPLSPRYGDRIGRWREGDYFRIPASRERALDGALGVLILDPKS